VMQHCATEGNAILIRAPSVALQHAATQGRLRGLSLRGSQTDSDTRQPACRYGPLDGEVGKIEGDGRSVAARETGWRWELA
jgi:hypothetical protein